MKHIIAGILIFWLALGGAAPFDPDNPPDLNQNAPSQSGVVAVGTTVVHTLPVEGGPTVFSVQWDSGSVEVSLVCPAGRIIDADFVANNPDLVIYESDTNSAMYYLLEADPGEWQVQLTAGADVPAGGAAYHLFTVLESTLTLAGETDRDWYAPGNQAVLSASLSEVPATATVTADIAYSDGTTATVSLDPIGAQDFEGRFTIASIPGYALVSLSVEGTKTNAAPFARSHQWLVQVSPASAQLGGWYQDVPVPNPAVAGLYAALDVRVEVDSTMTGTLGLSGDLVNANGELVAHSTTTAEVSPGTHTLTLSFVGSDIFGAQRHGPYRLTRLLLVDQTEGFQPVAEAEAVYQTQAYNYRLFASRRDYPSVQSGGPYAVDEGGTLTLMAKGADPEGEALAYAWDGSHPTDTHGEGRLRHRPWRADVAH